MISMSKLFRCDAVQIGFVRSKLEPLRLEITYRDVNLDYVT